MSHPNNSNISAAPTPIISKAKKKKPGAVEVNYLLNQSNKAYIKSS